MATNKQEWVKIMIERYLSEAPNEEIMKVADEDLMKELQEYHQSNVEGWVEKMIECNKRREEEEFKKMLITSREYYNKSLVFKEYDNQSFVDAMRSQQIMYNIMMDRLGRELGIPQSDNERLNTLDPTSPEWLELYNKINNIENGKI